MTHRRALLTLAWIAIVVAVVAVRPRQTPGPYLRDFEAYWSAGAVANAQADPYGRAIWQAERAIPGVVASRDELLPFVGPPQVLLAWRLVARLPYGPAASLWSLVLVVSLIALAAAASVGSGSRALIPVVAALALAVAFGPVTSDVALGQLALPAFLGATLVVLLARRSVVAAGVAALFAYAQPNAAISLVSQIGRNRATLALLAAAIATYALGVVGAGWRWPATYARVLAAHAAAERFTAIQFSPAAVAYGFGATPLHAALAWFVVALLAIAAAIVLAFRMSEAFARFAAFSALAPFVAGFFHEHDLLVAYVAAVWCALRTHGSDRLVALAGTLLVAIDWLGLAQRPSGIAQSALLAFAALAAFAAFGERVELRGAAVVAGAIGLLFAAAAIVAAHHPAPVWPDALGAFRAPPDAKASTLWSMEQRAAGLLAAVPAWAFLRSLSLAGCALLAYAIYRHPSCCRTALSRSDGSS